MATATAPTNMPRPKRLPRGPWCWRRAWPGWQTLSRDTTMSGPTVSSQAYGKSKVRLSRIFRDEHRQEIVDWTLSIALEGDFDAAYTKADNSKIVATDTMKNTVYVLAARHAIRSIEGFAQLLAGH